MKEFFENFYSGLKHYTGLNKISPLKKRSPKANLSDTFPKMGILTPELKTRLEEVLKTKIVGVEYFEQALTHRSYLQIATNPKLFSNERLEFLGDAVLGMVVGEYLFTLYTEIPEGDLTKLRSRLVNKGILAAVAKQLGIDTFMLMSFGAAKSLEAGSDSILGDAMEAIIAAIYIDTGIEATRSFIIDTMLPYLLTYEKKEEENYKSILLEKVQAKGMNHPIYEVLEATGPDHDKVFRISVSVEGRAIAIGVGKSKKSAEQNAAKHAIPKIDMMFGKHTE